MSPVASLILFVAALVISVAMAPKLRTNIGILALALSFIIGMWFYDMSSAEIVNLWPLRIMYIIMLANIFFGYVGRAGVMKGVADRIMYASRKATWAIPIMLYITTYAVSALGAGLSATPFIMSPLAFMLAAEAGFSPLLAVAICFLGAGNGSGAAWTADAAFTYGQGLEYIGGEAEALRTVYACWTTETLIGLIIFFGLYFGLKGYRINKNAAALLKKPEPFTREQRRVLYVLFAFILLVALPPIVETFVPNPVTAWMSVNLEVRVLLLAGSLILSAMKAADVREVLREDVPWGLLVMLCGMGTLVGLATRMGVIELLAGWITTSVPSWLIIPALVLVGGIMTMFTSGMVVLQTFIPLLSVISGMTGISMIGMYAALNNAVCVPGISPFSTGGSMALVGCKDEKVRESILPKQIALAFLSLGVAIIIAFIGYYKIW